MRIYLDNRPITDTLPHLDGQPSGVDELVAWVGQVQAYLEPQGRTLACLAVNGRPLEGDWTQALAAFSMDQITSLHMESATVQELFHRTVADAETFLAQLGQSLEQVAWDLRRGLDDTAFQALPQAIDGLQAYIHLLQNLVHHGVLPPDQVQARVEALTTALAACMDAWQGEDYVLLADHLLHRLSEEVKGQRRWLEGVALALAGSLPAEVTP